MRGRRAVTPFDFWWVMAGLGVDIALSCAVMPWVVLGEMQRQREAEQMPGNVVQFRRRG